MVKNNTIDTRKAVKFNEEIEKRKLKWEKETLDTFTD